MTEIVKLLHTVLASPEDDGPGELLFAARAAHYTLPYLTLSAIAASGRALGPASGDELRRAERRHEVFLEVERRLVAGHGARPLKGSVLQDLYPPGILRGRGDVDLLVPASRIWAAARDVVAAYPVEHVEITTIDGLGDVVIAMYWTGEDYLNDPALRVELCTSALLGDFGAVPVRRELPEDPLIASMCLLAEEHLQRRQHPRDLVDVYVADRSGRTDVEALAGWAARLRLAPELLALVAAAAEAFDLHGFRPLLTLLPPLAAEERARRDTAEVRRPRLRFAYPLSDLAALVEEPRLLTGADGESVLLSPVGAYLMVDGGTVRDSALAQGAALLREWRAVRAG